MEKGRFPNKLKMIRRCHGYSQKKVARILGLADTSTLSRWERGGAMPSVVQVFRLARIYQTLPHELFEELWNHCVPETTLLAQDEEPFTTNHSIFV
jgi:transcriptional regulator with XRE-family HTH domain